MLAASLNTRLRALGSEARFAISLYIESGAVPPCMVDDVDPPAVHAIPHSGTADVDRTPTA
jgi:hypothetical protein